MSYYLHKEHFENIIVYSITPENIRLKRFKDQMANRFNGLLDEANMQILQLSQMPSNPCSDCFSSLFRDMATKKLGKRSGGDSLSVTIASIIYQ